MITTPDKFEDLTHQQILEFARISFDYYQRLKRSVLTSEHANECFQEISAQQQDMQRALNSNTQKILEAYLKK